MSPLGHLGLMLKWLWTEFFQCIVIEYIFKWGHLSSLPPDSVDTKVGKWFQRKRQQPLFIFLCTVTTFIIYANSTLVYQYPAKVTCYLISCLFPLLEMNLSKPSQPHMHILIKLHKVPVRSSKEMIGQHFSYLPALEVSRQSHHFTNLIQYQAIWLSWHYLLMELQLSFIHLHSFSAIWALKWCKGKVSKPCEQ